MITLPATIVKPSDNYKILIKTEERDFICDRIPSRTEMLPKNWAGDKIQREGGA